MAINVVDASALAAIVFNEPDNEQIAARLEHNRMVAPELLWFEMASICLKKIHRYAEQRDSILASYSLLDRIEIKTVDIDYQATILLAETTDLTVYDASYLWVARALSCDLITNDKSLLKASLRV